MISSDKGPELLQPCLFCISHHFWKMHVTTHAHSGICHFGKRKMSMPLHTVANKSQMNALIKLRMTLSLHVPFICNKVRNYIFSSAGEDQIIWQSVFEISIVNARCTNARSSYALHCGRCHCMAQSVKGHTYSGWHNSSMYAILMPDCYQRAKCYL